MTEIYTKNKILTLDATVIPQPGITISIYEWKINNSIVLGNLNLITINTNNLSIGDNTISLRVKNSCGSWSEYITKTINITNEATNMEKIVTVVVDQPVETVTIVMDYVGTIEIVVTNGVNPVSGVTIDLNNVPTGLSTDIDGKVSIPNVPYGTHTLKVMKV